MMIAVPAALRTFRLHYRSRRALAADHAAYWVHGGMLVPDQVRAPPPGTEVRIEVRAPGDQRFVFRGTAGRVAPGLGFLVNLHPAPEREALDGWVTSSGFRTEADAEGTGSLPPPVLEDEDGDRTDPQIQAPSGWLFGPSPAAAGPEARTEAPREPPTDPLPTSAGSPEVRPAGPGEAYLAVVLRYPTVIGYLADAARLETTASLVVEAPPQGVNRADPVLVRLTLPGHNVFELWAMVGSTGPTIELLFDRHDERFRRVCLFPTSHQARNRREREESRGDPPGERTILYVQEAMPSEDDEKMPLRRRLQRMGTEEKVNMALSGNREERMALAQDSNKAIHHYLLKNAKLTLDEVAFMARLPSLNPDVLDKIAENPAYTQNPTVTKALVFNPRTPLRTALRLLDRLPRSELVVLSKRTGMHQRLVLAAKNRLTGGKW